MWNSSVDIAPPVMLTAVKDYSRLAIVASFVELILMLFSMDCFRYAEVIHIIKLTL